MLRKKEAVAVESEPKEQKFAAAAAAAGTILEAMIDGVSIVDEMGNLVQLNTPYAKMLGYDSPEELVGRPLAEFIPEQEAKKIKPVFTEVEKKGFVRNLETVIIDKNKKEIPVMLNLTALKDSSGRMVGVLAVVRDITELKKAQEQAQKAAASEAAVKEAEAGRKKLETYLESIIDGVGVTDINGNIVMANAALAALTGYTKGELLKMNPAQLTAEKDVEKNMNAMKECSERGLIRGLEINFVTKQRKEVPISLNATALKDPDGKPMGTIAVLRDITERKKAEEKIKRIFDLPNTLIMIAKPDGTILDVSVGWKDTLGYSPKDMVGKPFFEFIHPDDLKESKAGTMKVSDGKTIQYFENRYQHKNGSYRTLVWAATSKDSKTGLNYGFAQDITELKRIQEKEREAVVTKVAAETIEAMVDGVGTADLNMRITGVNKACLRLFGYKKEEMIGKRVIELFSESERAILKERAREDIEKGIGRVSTYTGVTKSGKEFPVQVSVSLRKDESGKPIELIAVLRGITETRNLTEELQSKVKELEDFHDVAVGRELEMINLEKEVEKLKKVKRGHNLRD